MLKRFGYKLAQKYIKWHDGFSYNFDKNGEAWIIDQTSALNFQCVFDVGANVGKWSEAALSSYQSAKIHAFELVDSTFQTLTTNIDDSRITINNCGLSHETATITYKCYGANSGVNTILTDSDFHDAKTSFEFKQGHVQTGEAYCKANGIDFIDFLKIDVEGAEHMVLQGFETMLSSKSIRLVQFEYGYTNGDTRFLMRHFYEFFANYGYVCGRLRQGYVDFSPWNYRLNDFNSGPNYVAIREDDKELLALLDSSAQQIKKAS